MGGGDLYGRWLRRSLAGHIRRSLNRLRLDDPRYRTSSIVTASVAAYVVENDENDGLIQLREQSSEVNEKPDRVLTQNGSGS